MLVNFIAAAVIAGTPLLFATLGAILNEKVGALNLGVEGLMAMGAFAGFMGGYYSDNLAVAILCAFAAGAFGALIYAVLTITLMASQNVAEFTDAWISLNQARVTLNRGMLRLQSSVATQINGGQLNELVETAKNLLADAQAHFDKYYALPNTPGLGEDLPKQLEEQYRIYSATLTQMNVLLAQGNLEDMFKQNAEQKQNAMQKARLSRNGWRVASRAVARCATIPARHVLRVAEVAVRESHQMDCGAGRPAGRIGRGMAGCSARPYSRSD